MAGTCQTDPPPGEAAPTLVPAVIDFGVAEPGMALEAGFGLVNLGLVPFGVTGFSVAGSTSFALLIEGQPFAPGEGSAVTATLPEPWTVGGGGALSLGVRYAPVDESAVTALIAFETSLPGPQPTLTVLGGAAEACASLSPSSHDFGATLIGATSEATVSLSSCGAVPLTVTGVSVEPAGGPFGVTAPPLPLTVTPGGDASFTVTYAPVDLAESGSATLTVGAASGPLGQLTLSGFAVDAPCPKAVATALEGPLLNPGTILHLDGSESFSPAGAVTGWAWSATQPDGSVAGFHPSSSLAKPTFPCDVIGAYTFELEVTDAAGQPSCEAGSVDLEVVPAQVLHIELLWETPGDPDPADEGFGVGTDVDLHLLHPDALGDDVSGDGQPDGWFDPVWDCNWTNPDPEWGDGITQDDDPHMVRLDFDGAGPESIALDVLEDGATYRIGVHYRNQYAYGDSTARVRVFVLGALAWQSAPVTLQMFDLWDAATLTWLGWPDASIQPVTAPDGAPVIWPGVLP